MLTFKVTVILHTFLNEGDEVIVPTPNWPNMKWAAWLDSPAREIGASERAKVVKSMPGRLW